MHAASIGPLAPADATVSRAPQRTPNILLAGWPQSRARCAERRCQSAPAAPAIASATPHHPSLQPAECAPLAEPARRVAARWAPQRLVPAQPRRRPPARAAAARGGAAAAGAARRAARPREPGLAARPAREPGRLVAAGPGAVAERRRRRRHRPQPQPAGGLAAGPRLFASVARLARLARLGLARGSRRGVAGVEGDAEAARRPAARVDEVLVAGAAIGDFGHEGAHWLAGRRQAGPDARADAARQRRASAGQPNPRLLLLPRPLPSPSPAHAPRPGSAPAHPRPLSPPPSPHSGGRPTARGVALPTGRACARARRS